MARKTELDLAEDMRHQRHEWRAEHIGWWVMSFILLAAVAGLLGAGPLSWTTAGDPTSALWVEHQRFARYQAPTEIKVHFRPEAAADEARIALDRDFFLDAEIEVVPEPEKTETGGSEVVFTFPLHRGQDRTTVLFRVKATQRWRRDVRISLNDARSVTFPIFIYP